MLSIIPGIEKTAPLRTDTSSGSAPAPKRWPMRSSSAATAASTCASSPSGHSQPACIACTQAAVVIVKPSGTGRPSFVMSARPLPLPPSRSLETSAASANE